ncbi:MULTISPECIES: maleate cis-trans isomerase family protein [unclassified Streptomyces]|uniref:maleate cis-trans isomerase family protein n=1 Tax=unclassified Streptomyces TaxID=2593676 RepID=UPI00224D7829|nr:arylmalonate decarboxylase [Streptomyces sp. NBC_00340]MCX5136577.1 arylmalonate decarboxylase [Streptomyces sp. NBC_00340]
MDLFSLPRLGVVVPPENPTAEPEFNHLLGTAMNVYTSRFPVTPGAGLRAMLETYNEVLPALLDSFGELRLDATVVACSASHYLLGPEGDRAFCDALSQRAGSPVRSSTQAILAACETLGVDRLTLVSPYQPWLTDTSRSFWERAGLTVDGVVLVPARADADGGAHYDPYEVTTRTILGRIRERELPADTALLFTGTGMGTLAALNELARRDPGRALLSSNLASAWWARRVAGVTEEAHHPLLRRLERTSGRASVRT